MIQDSELELWLREADTREPSRRALIKRLAANESKQSTETTRKPEERRLKLVTPARFVAAQ